MAPQTLILGIGNLLWADEGFGVRAAEFLDQHYTFPSSVRVMDGGTQGLYLVHHIEEADLLVVFDAIDYGLPPGTLKLIEGDAVPKYMGAKKMSLHQTGFQEVLAMAEMLERYPRELLLIGVQPLQIEDYGGSLTRLMRSQVEPAVKSALDWLSQRGVSGQKRAAPLTGDQLLAGGEINLNAYESERPSAEVACRKGDDRVLNSPDFHIEYKPHPVDPDSKISCDVDHRGKY